MVFACRMSGQFSDSLVRLRAECSHNDVDKDHGFVDPRYQRVGKINSKTRDCKVDNSDTPDEIYTTIEILHSSRYQHPLYARTHGVHRGSARHDVLRHGVTKTHFLSETDAIFEVPDDHLKTRLHADVVDEEKHPSIVKNCPRFQIHSPLLQIDPCLRLGHPVLRVGVLQNGVRSTLGLVHRRRAGRMPL